MRARFLALRSIDGTRLEEHEIAPLATLGEPIVIDSRTAIACVATRLVRSPDGRGPGLFAGTLWNDDAIARALQARGVDVDVHDHAALAVTNAMLGGPDGIGALRFHGALWLHHRAQDELVFARDVLGCGPAYVRVDAHRRLVCASDLPALVAVTDLPSLDVDVLRRWWRTGLCAGSQTPWTDLVRVPAGGLLRFGSAEPTLHALRVSPAAAPFARDVTTLPDLSTPDAASHALEAILSASLDAVRRAHPSVQALGDPPSDDDVAALFAPWRALPTVPLTLPYGARAEALELTATHPSAGCGLPAVGSTALLSPLGLALALHVDAGAGAAPEPPDRDEEAPSQSLDLPAPLARLVQGHVGRHTGTRPADLPPPEPEGDRVSPRERHSRQVRRTMLRDGLLPAAWSIACATDRAVALPFLDPAFVRAIAATPDSVKRALCATRHGPAARPPLSRDAILEALATHAFPRGPRT